ncbi:O-antigen ligase family protein [Streptomyces sp. NPDC004609]|uniref:O-antigen ligase family protein n=1 Tax=Streptomyces sp. NPDC004609 TaxID=3364704 RepID=UPI0036B7B4B0
MMAAPDSRAAARERGSATDIAGAVVLGVCAVWSLVSAAGREARPEGVLLAVSAVAAGYACGRISGTLLPVTSATALSLAALGLALTSPEGVPGANAGAPVQPGHTGAAAALLVLSAGAACCAASAARPPALRLALRLIALAAVVTGLAVGSVAGFAACAGVLLCSVATARMRRRTAALTGLAAVTGLAVVIAWGVAENALPSGLKVSLEGQLTPNRMALWQDAVALAEDDPVRGVGPGRFGKLSATALQSAGSDGKPHSALFQQAAEQGLVGVVLLATAFGWMLFALWRSPRSTPVVLSAGAALTALAVLANLGNALSFAPVTAGAGLLAGLATARGAGGGVSGPAGRTPPAAEGAR